MADFTGKAIDVVTFLMGDRVDKDQLWDLSTHKEPHTNQQRKYFHRLVGLLARGEQATFNAKKNELIMHYGNQKFVYNKDGKPIVEYLPDDDRYKFSDKHFYPLQYGGKVENSEGRGIVVRAFLLLEGTSRYSAKEYLALIEGARNECIGSGISMNEVETYEEKRLMDMLRLKANEESKNESNGHTTTS